MGRLVHPGLGSSSLVAHVLYYLPPREQLCNRSCSNTGTHTFRRPSTTWVTRDRSGARYSGLHGKHADVLGCCRAAYVREVLPSTRGEVADRERRALLRFTRAHLEARCETAFAMTDLAAGIDGIDVDGAWAALHEAARLLRVWRARR